MEEKVIVHKVEDLFYFTNNEEIKEGFVGWVIATTFGDSILEYVQQTIFDSKVNKVVCILKEDQGYFFAVECRKIVATNNPELWCNVCEGKHPSLCSKCMGSSIARISIDFIESFVREQGIWEVMLEKEGFVQSTTYEGDEPEGYRYKLNSQGEVIWHPVKERVHTKAELKLAFIAGGNILPCVSDKVARKHYGAANFEEWYKDTF